MENNINEYIQILDKVRHGGERGYITGEIGGKLVVMIKGRNYLVDPKDLKQYNEKQEPTLGPPMKFDDSTLKLLFEQYVECGIYLGNTPIKINDCFVKYNQWESSDMDKPIRVLVEGSPVYFPKSQIKIFEDINDFANEQNYIPGVIVDEETEEALENILIHAIDYTNAIGDAAAVRVIKTTEAGDQELQSVPRAMLRTLAI